MFKKDRIERMQDEYLMEKIEKLTESDIGGIFAWTDTEEGHCYWSKVSRSLRAKLKQLEDEKLRREIEYAEEADSLEMDDTLLDMSFTIKGVTYTLVQV